MLNCGQFAVIQRLEVEEWPLLFPEDDSLTGVIDNYNNLQELLGEHIIPA